MFKGMDYLDATIAIGEVGEWDKWREEIPFVSFPPYWEVKIIPPFFGAIVRYIIRHKSNPDHVVSIYLDCYNVLGWSKGPYWEIYPDINDENSRYGLNDIDGLLEGIEESINKNLKAEIK